MRKAATLTLLSLSVVTISAQAPTASPADRWIQFRGTPPLAGLSDEAVRASHTRAPIVWGDRIYVTTAVPAQAGTPTVITGASDKAGIDSAKDMVAHTWRLMAFDKASGKILWDKVVHEGVPRLKRHVKASHASATPATDGKLDRRAPRQRRSLLLRHERQPEVAPGPRRSWTSASSTTPATSGDRPARPRSTTTS